MSLCYGRAPMTMRGLVWLAALALLATGCGTVRNILGVAAPPEPTVTLRAAEPRWLLVRNTRFDVKILGGGELTKKLTVTVHRASASAREKIEAAGGSVTALKEPKVRRPKTVTRRPAAAEEPEAEAGDEPEAVAEDAHDRHRTVDDKPFGGGPGMLLKPEPIFEAVEGLAREGTRVILLTPAGRTFNQAIARELANPARLSSARQRVAREMFYEPGSATDRAVALLHELLDPARTPRLTERAHASA